MAKVQPTNPNVVWNPRPMTEAEAQKLKQEVDALLQGHDRIVREAFGI